MQEGGRRGRISVPWVQKSISNESDMPKIGGLHTSIALIGHKMQKPHFWHPKLVFTLIN